jgi:hypothetical protein
MAYNGGSFSKTAGEVEDHNQDVEENLPPYEAVMVEEMSRAGFGPATGMRVLVHAPFFFCQRCIRWMDSMA